MRCTSSNTNRISSMPSGLLLLAALLACTVGAQYLEVTTYTDEACEDLNTTLLVNGILSSAGVVSFDTCSDTSNGSSTFSATYECADNEATMITYDNEDCSGTSIANSSVYDGLCSNSTIGSCTAGDIDWEISTIWSVHATFYSDDSCSEANGETRDFTKSQFLAMLDKTDGCDSSDGSVGVIRCINGDLGFAVYGDSDTTCSLAPEMASTDVLGCESSPDDVSDLGAYLKAYCTTGYSSVGCTFYYSWWAAAAAAATAFATALA